MHGQSIGHASGIDILNTQMVLRHLRRQVANQGRPRLVIAPPFCEEEAVQGSCKTCFDRDLPHGQNASIGRQEVSGQVTNELDVVSMLRRHCQTQKVGIIEKTDGHEPFTQVPHAKRGGESIGTELLVPSQVTHMQSRLVRVKGPGAHLLDQIGQRVGVRGAQHGPIVAESRCVEQPVSMRAHQPFGRLVVLPGQLAE